MLSWRRKPSQKLRSAAGPSWKKKELARRIRKDAVSLARRKPTRPTRDEAACAAPAHVCAALCTSVAGPIHPPGGGSRSGSAAPP